MADQTNLDLVKLEKRIFSLEKMLRILHPYIVSSEQSLRGLEKLVEASNSTTDAEVTMLLCSVARLRGLAPDHLNKLELIKALLEDEHGVKLHFPTKAAGRLVPRR
jgi:hypothetical protein